MTGSCLCGRVTYELVSPVQFINHCHCSKCRKAHGAAFGTFAQAEAKGFRWTSGADLVGSFESSPDNVRCFCRNCGSPVPTVQSEADRVRIPAGGLDGDPGARPVFHLFVGSRATWFEIYDELPQFEELPPGT